MPTSAPARGLLEALERSAGSAPTAPALLAPGRPALSYASLLEHLRRVHADLSAAGLAGRRVALALSDGPELAAAFLGTSTAAACAPLNPAYGERELEFALDDARVAGVVVPAGVDTPSRRVALRRGLRVLELRPTPEGPAGVFTLHGVDGGADRRAAPSRDGDRPGPDAVALLLHTSGTTARPKLVPLTHANLCASARHVAASLELTAADRGLEVMPLFHIHGLVAGLLAPLWAGGSVACTPGVGGFPHFLEWLEELRPTWYTAVPTMHQAILGLVRGRGAAPASRLRFIRSSSSPLSPTLIAELEARFGVPVVEAYGMTEAAHQMASNPLPPRPRKPGSVGVAAGPELAVVDEAWEPVATGGVGEVVVRGENLTAGYEGRAEANRASFRDGWFRTGDLGRLDEDGYLFLTGRLKEQINRGGEKIAPREIDEALLEHPAVVQAAAFAVPDERLGEDVGAAVVLAEGADADAAALRGFLSERLAAFKVPRHLVVVDRIPMGPTGKLQRIGLADALGLTGSRELRPKATARRTPGDTTQTRLAAICADVLGVADVATDATFLASGGDSLLATLVRSRVNEELGVDLPLTELLGDATLADLAVRLGRRALVAPPGSARIRRPRPDPPPLSSAQRRIRFLERLAPGSPAYNRPGALRLEGPLDRAVLDRVVSELVRRHEALRTAFPADEPVQRVRPAAPVAVPVEDLGEVAPAARDAELARRLRAEARRPFDVESGPPFRARLFRLGSVDHVVSLTAHHMVLDEWSQRILTNELWHLYEAYARGVDSPLAEPPLQLADHAAQEQEPQSPERLETLTAYWRAHLAGVPPLDLPTDRPRPARQSFEGATLSDRLPARLASGVRDLASRSGATPFMVWLAGLQVLLYRYAGQERFAVGTPASGRTQRATEGTVGFLVRTLVLRADLTGRPSFLEVVRRVRDSALGGFDHQDLSFERIVEVLAPPRDPGRSPLFQVMFQLRNIPEAEAPSAPMLLVSEHRVDAGIARHDLVLELHERPDGVACRCDYATDLFDAARIRRLLVHYRVLLESAVAQPDQPVDALSLLAPEEKRRVVSEWCGPAPQPSVPHTLHALFEAQVDRTPEALALVDEAGSLSYAELDRRSNRVAHELRAAGAGSGAFVGIHVERRAEMVIGLLGTLKAGAAFVPLDTHAPSERLRLLIEDSGVAAVLALSERAGVLEALTARVVPLDGEAVERSPASRVPLAGSPADVAYLLYTSGSTGTPKGVLVEHAAIVNYALGVARALDLTACRSFAMLQPLSVDSSQTVVWAALLHGGCLHLISDARAADPVDYAEYCARQPIDCLKIAPSHLAALAGRDPRPVLPRLRLIVGGEAWPAHWAGELARLAPGCRVFGHYGPTEATVGVLTHAVDPDLAARPGSVPLGRPLPNVLVYILDARGRPVPAGVPGEICLGGRCLARGYHRRDALTAERFVGNPFGEGRLYRTGDRGRFLDDGTVEFLGRTDDQVKVRGFRIDLAEVEGALARHPDVGAAAVVAVEEAQAGGAAAGRLAAYVVPRVGGRVEPRALRAFLKARLPEHMVPGSFVVLDALPRTAHGKVERRALPSLPVPELPGDPVPPRDAVEAALAAMWSEVLDRAGIGVHDDLFELGAHSLMAMRVASRIRREFQVELPVRRVFETPSVSGLAEYVTSRLRHGPGPEALPLVRVLRDGRLPLSSGQELLWFFQRLNPATWAWNTPIVLRLRGQLDTEALGRSLGAVAERHEVLRSRFRAVDGVPFAVTVPGVERPLAAIELGAGAEPAGDTELGRLIERQVRAPFDLAEEPPSRVALYRLGGREHVLSCVFHHIAHDRWSRRVFLRELAEHYAAFVGGREPRLPELAFQFADFAAWERRWLETPEAARQTAYWTRRLSGAPAALALPFDRPPGGPATGAGRPVVLPRELTRGLLDAGRERGVSLFMGLLAGFAAVLADRAGQTDVVLGTTFAGRGRVELEELIGCFARVLPLRIDLSGDPSFAELLERVRATTLGAYAHADVPIQNIVQALRPARPRGRAVLVQAVFTLHNAPAPEAALAGLEVEAPPHASGDARSELGLSLQPDPDGLRGRLEYRSDLFEEATIDGLIEQLRATLEAAVGDPSIRLSGLSRARPW